MRPSDDKYRLFANGVVFHKLNYEQLVASLLGLSKTLYHPTGSQMPSMEHRYFWAWCGELILSSKGRFLLRPKPIREAPEEDDYEALFSAVIHCALAGSKFSPKTMMEARREDIIESLHPYHDRHLVRESMLLLSYMIFPLLDVTLKRLCSNFVDIGGNVVGDFEVPDRRHVSTQKYGPKNGKNRCSSVRDLLYLFTRENKDTDLEVALEKFIDHVSVVTGDPKPYDCIGNWRNISLHGQKMQLTIGGILLNLCLLLSLARLKPTFDSHKNEVIRSRSQFPAVAARNYDPWTYYPPVEDPWFDFS